MADTVSMMTTSLKRRRYVTDDGTEETNSLEKIKSMIEDLEHQMVELHIENVTRQVEISKLRKEIAEVTWSTENLSAESTGQQTQLSELRTEVDSLVPASDMVFDMRYRAFLVCLRDIWGIENEAVRKRVGAAGKELVHADIKVDARMFFVKGLAGEDELYFKKIYGVTPKVVVDLESHSCNGTLKVLNHVGALHLNGRRLRAEAEKILEVMLEHVDDLEFERAEEESEKFPMVGMA